jgi:cytoskeleton protein RodZ
VYIVAPELSQSIRESLPVGAFGERLKREREQRKITLQDVAAATKIGSRMLGALEDEKFDLLPGGIFNKGFVRAYARHLAINEDEVVAAYTEAYRAAHPEQSAPADPDAETRKIMEQRALHMIQTRPRMRMDNLPWGKAAVAVVALALGIAWWGSYRRHSISHPVVADVSRTAAKPADPAKAVEPRRSQSPPKTIASPAARPAAESDDPTSPAEPTLTSVSEVVAPSTGFFRVLIRAREDSWIQITADGKQVLQDTLLASSQKSVGARSEIVIKAGNIGALEFWFNGQKLPAQGDLDQVKTLTFDASGLVSSTARIQPVSSAVDR